MLSKRFLFKQPPGSSLCVLFPTHISEDGYCRHQLRLETNQPQSKDVRTNEAEGQNHSHNRSPLLYSPVLEENHISVTRIHLPGGKQVRKTSIMHTDSLSGALLSAFH